MARSPALPALLLLLTPAACARDADAGAYPSLARRPAEGMGFAEPTLPPPPPLAVDPALDAAVARLRARLGEVAAGFDRDAAAAERAGAAARGRAVGSEAWLGAQTALAQLDDWRAQVSALATDADALAATRAAALQSDYPALATVSEAIRAEAEKQTATIARIQALTPQA